MMCLSTLMGLLTNIKNMYKKPLISYLKLDSILILTNASLNAKRPNT